MELPKLPEPDEGWHSYTPDQVIAWGATVRREALEEAAKVCETQPLETYMSEPYIRQTQSNRLALAAAIRALIDVSPEPKG